MRKLAAIFPCYFFPIRRTKQPYTKSKKLKLGNNPLPFVNHHVTVVRYQQCHHRSQSFSLDLFSSFFFFLASLAISPRKKIPI
jgi:hypothetical protein